MLANLVDYGPCSKNVHGLDQWREGSDSDKVSDTNVLNLSAVNTQSLRQRKRGFTGSKREEGDVATLKETGKIVPCCPGAVGNTYAPV